MYLFVLIWCIMIGWIIFWVWIELVNFLSVFLDMFLCGWYLFDCKNFIVSFCSLLFFCLVIILEICFGVVVVCCWLFVFWVGFDEFNKVLSFWFKLCFLVDMLFFYFEVRLLLKMFFFFYVIFCWLGLSMF